MILFHDTIQNSFIEKINNKFFEENKFFFKIGIQMKFLSSFLFAMFLYLK